MLFLLKKTGFNFVHFKEVTLVRSNYFMRLSIGLVRRRIIRLLIAIVSEKMHICGV